MVAGNNLGVRRRNALRIRAALSRVCTTVLLRPGRRAGVLLRPRGSAVVHTALLLLGLGLLAVSAMGRLDVDVCDAATAVLVGDSLVLVGRLGELCDDVPGVEEAGDEAEDAEEDVDEGVGATDAALDPDRQRGEENGEDAEEDVGRTHDDRWMVFVGDDKNRGLKLSLSRVLRWSTGEE